MSTWTLEQIKELECLHLFLPDTGLIDVTLATIVANMIPGKSVFTIIVGASGGGKSTQLASLKGLPYTYPADTFTEAGLLSGSSDGTPGLLKVMEQRALEAWKAKGGDVAEFWKVCQGILLFFDLTVLLSRSADERNMGLALLRKIYDGYVDRHLGTNGGVKEWTGHAGLLAGCTEEIFEAGLGSMGERFLYYHLPLDDDETRMAVALAALDAGNQQHEYERERSEAVVAFLTNLTVPDTLPAQTQEEKHRIAALADLGSKCRSVAKTDERTGRIRLVFSPESPSRLTEELNKMWAAFKIIGTPADEAWRLLGCLALGGIHPIRRQVIECLLAGKPHTPATIAGRIGLHADSIKQHLWELVALRVIDQDRSDPDKFGASEWLLRRWRQAHGVEEAAAPVDSPELSKISQLAAHFPGIEEVEPDETGATTETDSGGIDQ